MEGETACLNDNCPSEFNVSSGKTTCDRVQKDTEAISERTVVVNRSTSAKKRWQILKQAS